MLTNPTREGAPSIGPVPILKRWDFTAAPLFEFGLSSISLREFFLKIYVASREFY